MVTQSIIIPKSKFTEKQANAWIKKNNYTDKGKRIKNYKTTSFFRFRQKPPSHFKKGTIKTKMLKNGIGIVYGSIIKKQG
tara:strand:+ start:611 stop:850 length:240 start_codon:yes stop_codon:yes gene_type:complete